MKTKRLMHLFCIAALCTISGLAMAGMRFTAEGYVNDTYKSAGGSMTNARGSVDTKPFIGCFHWTGITPGRTPLQGFCQASNWAGLTRWCSTTNSNHIQTIRSISAESNFSFSWNTDGTCRYILVNNNSYYKPASTTGF